MSLPREFDEAMSDFMASGDRLAEIALLATQMKPEGALRDGVFLTMRQRGIPCAIEARSRAGVSRTDLVFTGYDGRVHAVEFKAWLTPDLATPSKILKGAEDDWKKHRGDVFVTTIISRVRSDKYFTTKSSDSLWQLDYPRGLIAHHLRLTDEWLHVGQHFIVSIVGPQSGPDRP